MVQNSELSSTETNSTAVAVEKLSQNMRLAEIAAVFNLTESRICQIHAQTVLGLRAYLKRVREK